MRLRRNRGVKMEYEKLEKPIYWIGWQKGVFTRRKFVERQVSFPRYLRSEDGEVRYFSPKCEFEIGKIRCVGGYSMYSYSDFPDYIELEFLRMIVKRFNEKIKQEQKKIGDIIKERDVIIDMIKEREA